MKSAVDVEDSAVQKMVEESVEHAFEDMAVRQWTEAKLRAEQTLDATAKALSAHATEIEPTYRAQIEAAVAIVRQALASENPETKTGDIQRLKAAHGTLDETTKPFAEMLMDKAMEALLRKRGLIQ